MAKSIKEVVNLIKKGQWLNLKLITANTNQKTGGSILSVKCRLARANFMKNDQMQRAASTGIIRPANHNENFTLNVQLPNSEIITIHPLLVFSVDNERVI
jgi:hypothetical protein